MITNPCTRCGTQRIVSKTWKEHVESAFGSSTVIVTESVCPNPDCQKVVDKELRAQKAKRNQMKKDKEDRLEKNKKKKPLAKPVAKKKRS